VLLGCRSRGEISHLRPPVVRTHVPPCRRHVRRSEATSATNGADARSHAGARPHRNFLLQAFAEPVGWLVHKARAPGGVLQVLIARNVQPRFRPRFSRQLSSSLCPCVYLTSHNAVPYYQRRSQARRTRARAPACRRLLRWCALGGVPCVVTMCRPCSIAKCPSACHILPAMWHSHLHLLGEIVREVCDNSGPVQLQSCLVACACPGSHALRSF
jgi:hypothetical protein